MALSREQCDKMADRTHAHEAKEAPRPRSHRGPGRAPTTWADKTFWEMPLAQKIASLDIGPESQYTEKPAGFSRGPVVYHSVARENAFILPMAVFPLAVQSLAYWAFPGSSWNAWAAWPLYHIWFVIFAYTNVKRLHYYAEKYGVLDEKVRSRDMIDDGRVDHLGWSILLYTMLRTAGPFMLAYNRDVMPLKGIDAWSPLRIMVWEVALDLFFYIYHSACHRVDALWFIHRAHHGTKHPTPILSILADDYQEIIELILCPTLAAWILPLTFAEGQIAIIYLLYVEMLGHSGIRAYWPHPLLSWILKPLDMELAVEDHDLHHRGGRGGQNYGKQTRVWDKLGGSGAQRVEAGGF